MRKYGVKAKFSLSNLGLDLEFFSKFRLLLDFPGFQVCDLARVCRRDPCRVFDRGTLKGPFQAGFFGRVHSHFPHPKTFTFFQKILELDGWKSSFWKFLAWGNLFSTFSPSAEVDSSILAGWLGLGYSIGRKYPRMPEACR